MLLYMCHPPISSDAESLMWWKAHAHLIGKLPFLVLFFSLESVSFHFEVFLSCRFRLIDVTAFTFLGENNSGICIRVIIEEQHSNIRLI